MLHLPLSPLLHWTPGAGGLLATLPAPRPILHGRRPPDSAPVTPLHLTLLCSASMAPLADTLAPQWQTLRQTLPPLPALVLDPPHPHAPPPPHPTNEPPDDTRPRVTWFLAAAHQAALHRSLAAIVARLDAADRRSGGPGLSHPEPDRFFHLSMRNNRGGDPRRSIGDIAAADDPPGAGPGAAWYGVGPPGGPDAF